MKMFKPLRFAHLHIILMLFFVAVGIAGCSKGSKEIIESFADPKEMSTVFSKDVSTLISDSGVTRYRVVAPEWYMYDCI